MLWSSKPKRSNQVQVRLEGMFTFEVWWSGTIIQRNIYTIQIRFKSAVCLKVIIIKKKLLSFNPHVTPNLFEILLLNIIFFEKSLSVVFVQVSANQNGLIINILQTFSFFQQKGNRSYRFGSTSGWVLWHAIFGISPLKQKAQLCWLHMVLKM